MSDSELPDFQPGHRRAQGEAEAGSGLFESARRASAAKRCAAVRVENARPRGPTRTGSNRTDRGPDRTGVKEGQAGLTTTGVVPTANFPGPTCVGLTGHPDDGAGTPQRHVRCLRHPPVDLQRRPRAGGIAERAHPHARLGRAAVDRHVHQLATQDGQGSSRGGARVVPDVDRRLDLGASEPVDRPEAVVEGVHLDSRRQSALGIGVGDGARQVGLVVAVVDQVEVRLADQGRQAAQLGVLVDPGAQALDALVPLLDHRVGRSGLVAVHVERQGLDDRVATLLGQVELGEGVGAMVEARWT